MELKNKVVFITGASGEIGSEVVKQFAEHGCRLVLQYRSNKRRLQEAIGNVSERVDHSFVRIDFADRRTAPHEVRKAVETTRAQYGVIDVLVALAGVTTSRLWGKRAIDYSIHDLESILNVDFFGSFLCCKEIAPIMVSRKTGSIVLLSAHHAVSGASAGFGWVVAKAAVQAMAKSLALELGPSVRVNAVAPGYINTRWVRRVSSASELTIARRDAALNRLGQPTDVAKAILFLASDDSQFITGQTLLVDGGTVIR